MDALGKPPNRKDVGKRLLELRRAEGLSQEEMAKTLAVSYKAYCNYENGLRDLPGALYFKVSNLYSVDPAWLYEGIGLGAELRHKGGEVALWREALVLVERHLVENSHMLGTETKLKVVDAVVAQMLAGGQVSDAYVAQLVDLAA